MRKILYIIAAITILTSACKTVDEPVNYIGKAEFYVSATANNSPLLFEAGNNNMVMKTENTVDSLNIKQFTGTIAKTCANCTEKLSITFRNYQVGNNSNWSIDSLYKIGKAFLFYNEKLPPISYRVVFNNQSRGDGTPDYTWDFGGGFGSKLENPNFIFKSEGKQNISLNVDYTGCVTNIESPIYIDANNLNNYIDYTYTNKGSNVFKCEVLNADSSTHKFIWKYLNEINSEPKGKIFELPAFETEGVYQVDLLAINKTTNDTTIVSKNIATAATNKCSANFSYNIVPVRDTLQLEKVIVEYTDKNGITYSSKYNEQFTGFFIDEISNYKNNATGQKTVKMKIKFTCRLTDGVNNIELKDVEAVFAFAY